MLLFFLFQTIALIEKTLIPVVLLATRNADATPGEQCVFSVQQQVAGERERGGRYRGHVQAAV